MKDVLHKGPTSVIGDPRKSRIPRSPNRDKRKGQRRGRVRSDVPREPRTATAPGSALSGESMIARSMPAHVVTESISDKTRPKKSKSRSGPPAQDPRLQNAEDFFAHRGWEPFAFQRELWAAQLEGASGLLHVPTGSGKTYAAVMGAFSDFVAKPRKGLKLLYVTPLRALARDLELALKAPIEQEGWKLNVQSRTGDTPSAAKRLQGVKPPDVLLITPESLAVLISSPEAEETFKHLEVVILDEWHELISNKRGSLTELNLAFLRSVNPDLKVWALSASIGNLEEAANVATGNAGNLKIISADLPRDLDVDILLPDQLDAFPWAGHLGFALRDRMILELDPEISTLIFTNTRSQAERWFAELQESVPDMAERIALHHGSLAREERERVEAGVKEGTLKWVVCTSSLDLGVDFQMVDRVVQIGSAKMVARFMQRAGRSAHRPGGKSRILFVPTNSWEILELEAVKKSLGRGDVESRRPLHKPIDVLIQHMMTLAAGPGLRMDELKLMLSDTHSFRDVTDDELKWCLRFLTVGGEVLQSYPQYRKLALNPESGRYRFSERRLETQHRMSIGTIVSRESVNLSLMNRSRLGSVEENFIAKLRPGDVFQFGGRHLEYVTIRDLTAFVKIANRPANTVPSWDGGLLPMSEELSQALRETMTEKHPVVDGTLGPLLRAQRERSHLPHEDEFLVEIWSSKEGTHFFAYPFAGRLVHEGLGQLFAVRFAKREPATFSFAINEYGFEIMGPKDYPFRALFDDDFFARDNLEAEIGMSLQLGEMTQRQFRHVASVAGLIFTGYPGARKTGKQTQVSAHLLYEVFTKYDPSNLLLKQARREVLMSQLETERLSRTLAALEKRTLIWKELDFPSPLAFPLFVGMGTGAKLSNESIEAKVARLKKEWST